MKRHLLSPCLFVAAAALANPAPAAEYAWTDAAGAHAVTLVRIASGDDVALKVSATLDGRPDWTVRDYVKECPVDVILDVVPASIEMRDLLGNGRKQFLFAYKIGCRGDISADQVKYFLVDGGTKYVMRGEETVTVKGKVSDGGAPPVPNADLKAHPAFLHYMTKHWRGISVRNYE
ncbi:M949_RS01915 family surface polysaccharide biosynthesis protein [Burkholderia cepacia]|uniref:M949_RS01915 family surface polysaccharide biosynthesis protein n=1 Tax=Burkholderia cepacia TaxID=292 RepID=UPI00398ECD55